MSSSRLLIYGAGSLGLAWAALLAADCPLLVYTRPGSSQAINQAGIKLSGTLDLKARVQALEQLPKLGAKDIVLICVKAHDLAPALAHLVDHYTELPTIGLIQNGFFIKRYAIDQLIKMGKKPSVLRLVTSLGAERTELNQVRLAGLGQTFIEASPPGKILAGWLQAAGRPPFQLADDMEHYELEKAIANSVINPLTTLTRLKNGELLKDEAALTRARRIIEEIVQILASEGFEFLPERQFDNIIDILKNTSDNTSSMLQDVISGRPTEIDFLLGSILELADRHELEAPTCREVYDQIRLLSHQL